MFVPNTLDPNRHVAVASASSRFSFPAVPKVEAASPPLFKPVRSPLSRCPPFSFLLSPFSFPLASPLPKVEAASPPLFKPVRSPVVSFSPLLLSTFYFLLSFLPSLKLPWVLVIGTWDLLPSPPSPFPLSTFYFLLSTFPHPPPFPLAHPPEPAIVAKCARLPQSS
jgi:hypothetical protein